MTTTFVDIWPRSASWECLHATDVSRRDQAFAAQVLVMLRTVVQDFFINVATPEWKSNLSSGM